MQGIPGVATGGVGIEGLTIENGEVVATLTDGQVINLGNVIDPKGFKASAVRW